MKAPYILGSALASLLIIGSVTGHLGWWNAAIGTGLIAFNWALWKSQKAMADKDFDA